MRFIFPLIALTALLTLEVACSGDEPPAPTATAVQTSTSTGLGNQARTATARATTLPSATPAVGVEPSASIQARATSSPSPAASTSTPTRTQLAATPGQTASPTPVPDLSFHFGEGVSVFERAMIITAVEVTRDLLATDARVRPPTAVFASNNVTELQQAFADNAYAQEWRAAGMAERLYNGIAEANYRGIAINVGSEFWRDLADDERIRSVAHEFVHVVQLENLGLAGAELTLSAPVNEVPPAGPFWLLEGSAEVVSQLVMRRLDLGDYDDALEDYARQSREGDGELSKLESYLDYRNGGLPGVAYATLATDYLLRNRDLSELFAFWRDIGQGTTWQDAFVRRFGTPVQFFYQSFAEYYESTYSR
jgi:hypothetical protein